YDHILVRQFYQVHASESSRDVKFELFENLAYESASFSEQHVIARDSKETTLNQVSVEGRPRSPLVNFTTWLTSTTGTALDTSYSALISETSVVVIAVSAVKRPLYRLKPLDP
ncbi:2139_t:CDS:2, partial [Acaulospora colombiana]